MKRLIAAPICLAVLAAAAAAFPDNASKTARAAQPPPDNEIVAVDCWVNLADKATLSCEITGILDFVPQQGDLVGPDRVNITRTGPDGKALKEMPGVVAGLQSVVAEAKLRVAEVKAADDINIRYAQSEKALAEQKHKKSLEANRKVRDTVSELQLAEELLEIEKQKLAIERARNQKNIAELERQQAEAELRSYKVHIKGFEGIVTKVYKLPGEAVRQGEPIVDVQSTKRVWVEGYIRYEDRHRISIGCEVAVLPVPATGMIPSADAEKFKGRIVFVAPTAERVGSLIPIKAELKNQHGRLIAGLKAKMTIREKPRAGD